MSPAAPTTMNFTSRGARTAARSLRRPIGRQPRRYASHGEEHGHESHGESALHVAGGSGSEGFSTSFYLVLAAIPISYAVYSLSTSKDNFLRRMIDQNRLNGEVDQAKLSLHTSMMAQALEDRVLFKTAVRDVSGPDLRFPEMFNTGSPINVAAGAGQADLNELVQHYKVKHDAMEEKRLASMKDGKVVPLYERSEMKIGLPRGER